jgi:hypothetical protein
MWKPVRYFRILILTTLIAMGGVVSSYAVTTLPTANVSGHLLTSATDLSLSPGFVSQVNYLDGSSAQINSASESIIGATVTLAATRAADPDPSDQIYPFNDGLLEVRGGDGYLYISATVTNLEITNFGDGTVGINPNLDANNPSTLNLTINALNSDATHPSRFVDEWRTALGGTTVAGMSIVALLNGDPAGASDSDILIGYLDGTPPAPPEAPGTRSMGFWKTHETERVYYLSAAKAVDDLHGPVFSDTMALETAVTLKGKKTMQQKAEQQLGALLLNIAQGLSESTPLTDAQKQNVLDPSVTTVGDAVNDISGVILNSSSSDADLERVKDLAESINTDE